MIGNFFAVTCPFLFELDTVAYLPCFAAAFLQDRGANPRNDPTADRSAQP